MLRSAYSCRALAAALAIVALPAQAVAQTKAQTCLSEAEVRALTAFAMPSALDGMIKGCSTQIDASSFMSQSGKSLVASYSANKDAAWPMARTAFFKLANDKQKDSSGMLEQMPDSALQPFVEGMIGGMVGAKIKPEQCRTADKLMGLLAPLPPENMVELVGTVMGLVGNDKKGSSGGFAICQA